VSYHDSFWLATGAAAPVIALAAVVALPDIAVMERRAWIRYAKGAIPPDLKQKDPAGDLPKQLWHAVNLIWYVSLFNMIIQAAVLAVSLSALASEQNVVPPWIAIVPAVGGIILLAWTLAMGVRFRGTLEKVEKIAIPWRSNED
jgi:hypothetical protein